MRKRQFAWIVSAAGILCAGLVFSPDSNAQVRYGSWQKTSDCRTLRAPAGPGRGRVELPQAPGSRQALECRWERKVEDCPRVRDKLRHPVRCTTRRQKSGYSQNAPRS